MTKHYLLALATLCTILSYSQEKYVIEYDYKTNGTKILHYDEIGQVDDTLKKPRFRRNSIVEVKLKNVNPFALSVQDNVQKTNHTATGMGFNPTSLFSGLNSIAGGKLNYNFSGVAKTADFSTNRSYGTETVERSEAEQETQRLLNSYNRKMQEYNTVLTGVKAIRTNFVVSLINPNLNREEIMTKLEESYTIPVEALENSTGGFYEYIGIAEQILDKDNEEILELLQSARLPVINSTTAEAEILGNRSDYQKEIQEIKALYAALETASFEKTYGDIDVDADRTTVDFTFYQSDLSNSLDKDDKKEVIREKKIRLFAKGGFKINTSVAITLNNFGSNSKDFFIKDNLIQEESLDYFVPNMSTMVNFYPFMSESFNIGGSFGISIPITTNETNTNGVNFLIGPSIFIGNKSRVSFTGGIAYGPVNRLRNGFQAGEAPATENISDITQVVYETGYFFGISFSLFDLTNQQ